MLRRRRRRRRERRGMKRMRGWGNGEVIIAGACTGSASAPPVASTPHAFPTTAPTPRVGERLFPYPMHSRLRLFPSFPLHNRNGLPEASPSNELLLRTLSTTLDIPVG
ncbi:hypothetical protein BO70DRAFT_146290 [Aspergillus heteromorphus CBS 117.55]|uniref:Uncharacterized protein n=1 Tax=Aspergillus heteromorphus CBS 117.55 TaxID=1448321 RepID=A0A317V629_9EURO|nr:uncharacterized protein BO70DRAFT_146290 [Aspergillus heteromorphus CBS 117.55]PWY69784.1 hypothetical protein BO70DRAFT_146290 [Aspergillus heteromorphus CBS 117.55]